MRAHPDVLVIGGGIVGLTSAYFLAKSGLKVEVMDKGDLGRESSWAGAGLIPPGNPARAATTYDKLRAHSVSRFPELSAELRELTGVENGYRRCGGFEFLAPDELYSLPLWDAEGIAFERLDRAEVARREPGVNPPTFGEPVFLPDLAQVRNPWHVRALVAACERLGVRLSPRTTFVGWGTIRSHVVAVQTSGSARKSAGAYLVAGGSWSELMLRPLGCRPAVAPVRGQIVLFRAERPLFSRVFQCGRHYLVPREDGRILVGSTVEPDAGFDPSTTPEAIDDLIHFARESVPGLAHAEVEKTWAGLRPGSPDGMPFLGPVPGYKNLFAATGHYRSGIQLSISTGEIMAKLVHKEPPPFPIDDLRLDRQPAWGLKLAFRT